MSLGLPPRPSLSSLGHVNNNPPSPYGAVSPTAAVAAAVGPQQQLLPNGRDVEPGGSGSPGSGTKGSAVFRMFMHAEASGSGAGSSNSSGLTVGPQPDGGPGTALDSITPDEAAEVRTACFAEYQAKRCMGCPLLGRGHPVAGCHPRDLVLCRVL